MKMYKKTLMFVVYLFVVAVAMGQTGDLGVMWEKSDYASSTTTRSHFTNVIPQTNGHYLACGYLVNPNLDPQKRELGYVVEIDENGERQREWFLTPPNQNEWTAGGNTANSAIAFALLSSSGDLTAYGSLSNPAATDKGHLGSSSLANGIWVTKLDANNNVLVNRIDRGSILYNTTKYVNEGVLIVGYDAYKPPVNSSGDYGAVLFRHYDKDLNQSFDYQEYAGNYYATNNASVPQAQAWTEKVYVDEVDPSKILLSCVTHGIIEFVYIQPVGGSTGSLTPKAVTNTTTPLYPPIGHANNPAAVNPADCLLAVDPSNYDPNIVPGSGYGNPTSTFTLKPGGGVWATGSIGSYDFGGGSRQVYGSFLALSTLTKVTGCEVMDPNNVLKTTNVGSPYALPNSTDQFIGTVSGGIPGITRVYTVGVKPDGSFVYTDHTSEPMPSGTSFSTPSLTDGIISSGSLGGKASLAKMSTCKTFESVVAPQIGVMSKSYSSTINVSVPGLDFKGGKGDVTYDIQAVVVNGEVEYNNLGKKVAGDILYTLVDQTPTSINTVSGISSGISVNLNDDFTIHTKHAAIEYRYTIRDKYTVAGVAQSCAPTYTFRVVIAPRTDVVAMPILVKEGTKNIVKATVKNIGAGAFDNYKIIIYDTLLGNPISYTYIHGVAIESGETVRLDIDLTGTAVENSTSLVVSFNDKGGGAVDQVEQSNNKFAYTIN